MSNEENAKQEENVQQEVNVKQTVDTAKNTVGNLVSSFLSLRENNPKVFFGSIGGVVALLLLMMSMGGDDSKPVISGPVLKDLAIGQRYVLKTANAYDPAATVRLVSAPGAIAAYDDTEEADRSGAWGNALPSAASARACVARSFKRSAWRCRRQSGNYEPFAKPIR